MKYGMWLDEWFRNYIQPSSKIKTCERYSEIIEKHLINEGSKRAWNTHKHTVWLDAGSKAGKVGSRCRYTDTTNSHESCR